MNNFDKIIGYSAIKKELICVADILKGNEFYKNLGVRIPCGLLLHGEPGLGKTLMASCLIEESGRTAITCRKDKPDGEFVKYIKEAFEKAKESAPSIVFLDDMDKFANGDTMHPDSEEYVAVQSCIDETKDCDVFVLATANRIHHLPDSLLRAGRFDRVIEVESPSEKDAQAIISHYLENKKIGTDVDFKLITRILDGNSCAELETLVNEAGLYAGFERSETIDREHFIKAALKMFYNAPIDAFDKENGNLCGNREKIAYHEAGHAVLNEILSPGSVTLASVYKNGCTYGGFVAAYTSDIKDSIAKRKNRALCSLGSMAAIEHIYGTRDSGAENDIDKAFDLVGRLITGNCINGFHLHCNGYEDSSELRHKQENAISAEVERLYHKAKEIIAQNTDLLHAIAKELLTKDIIDMYDIERIKNEIKNQKAA